MSNRFDEIYEKNEWGHGSGEGSLPIHTASYSKFLESFIKDHKISTVVEVGCGDWQFSKDLNWNGAFYRGYDVVKSVIESNKLKYARRNVEFNLYSGKPAELPSAELLIVKDVLQHLSDENVYNFIKILGDYRYCLITNCVNPRGKTVNRDIENGDFRYLDLLKAPFNVNAVEVYSFTNKGIGLFETIKCVLGRSKWLKKVILVDNSLRL